MADKTQGLAETLNHAFVYSTLTGRIAPIPDAPATADEIADLERRIETARDEMSRRVAECLFAPSVHAGSEAVVLHIPWRTRVAWRWYAVREWIAVHVLRVDVGGEE